MFKLLIETFYGDPECGYPKAVTSITVDYNDQNAAEKAFKAACSSKLGIPNAYRRVTRLWV